MNLFEILKYFIDDIKEIIERIEDKQYLILENVYSIEDLAYEAISLNQCLPFDLEDINPDVDMYDIGEYLLKNEWYIDYKNNLGVYIPDYYI